MAKKELSEMTNMELTETLYKIGWTLFNSKPFTEFRRIGDELQRRGISISFNSETYKKAVK